ncbi:hypothetical protein [Chryseobacterium koreense]|uniref:Uncharacterized protein n=1 Tax=Chryseobacterium koreense CCUG 49689 TaxID=1304281 RepID=A0A0J7IWZ9_9FLAO|nr:hypothetical protein [Chryseobacterium koreense]KMQ70813.1 hypothetical protein ACM44_09245 [Chryseobacterium koreense CCUG 49689]MBB5332549.1 hypothetical protein [Chryseobacterium koreense]
MRNNTNYFADYHTAYVHILGEHHIDIYSDNFKKVADNICKKLNTICIEHKDKIVEGQSKFRRFPSGELPIELVSEFDWYCENYEYIDLDECFLFMGPYCFEIELYESKFIVDFSITNKEWFSAKNFSLINAYRKFLQSLAGVFGSDFLIYFPCYGEQKFFNDSKSLAAIENQLNKEYGRSDFSVITKKEKCLPFFCSERFFDL